MNDAAAAPAVVVPKTPLSPFSGGYGAGQFFVGHQAYALIVSPKEDGELQGAKWGSTKKEVTGALSLCNGFANTLAMEAADSTTAKWARALRIGGFDDWYLPSRIEALLAFAELREQFERDWYWTSTQFAGDAECAWSQDFYYGLQNRSHKDTKLRARAVRRIAI